MSCVPATPQPSKTPSPGGRSRRREYATWVPDHIWRDLVCLSPSLQISFLAVRMLTRKSRWLPRPARLARLLGVPPARAADDLARLLREGFIQDQWLGRTFYPGPRAYVSARALLVLRDMGIPAEQQVLLFRLLAQEDGGVFRYNPREHLLSLGYGLEEVREALRTFRQHDLLRSGGVVAPFLCRPD